MKLFLLLTSFLFNVSTWALVDIEDNGHDIESPLTNLRLSVADDVPQVILTSNEVAASTDGSTCLVKLVKFCINTYDQGNANNRLPLNARLSGFLFFYRILFGSIGYYPVIIRIRSK